MSISPDRFKERTLIKYNKPILKYNISQLANDLENDSQKLQATTNSQIKINHQLLEKNLNNYNLILEQATNQIDKFIKKQQFFITTLNEKEEMTFQERYTYKEIDVFRFGILGFQLNNLFNVEQENQNQIEKRNKDTYKSNKSNKSVNENIILDYVELLCLSSAIQHLITSKQRAAIVDIFERDKQSNIKFTKEKLPDTHTIVIVKNDILEFLVIDPNNSNFSNHLSNSINQLLIRSIFKKQINILAPKSLCQIYTRPEDSKTGTEHGNYRDCIDISVKLALDFNQINQYIDIDQLSKNTSVLSLSNNLGQQLPNLEKSSVLSFRIKQTSDIIIRRQFQIFIVELDDQFTQTQYFFANYNDYEDILQKLDSLGNTPMQNLQLLKQIRELVLQAKNHYQTLKNKYLKIED